MANETKHTPGPWQVGDRDPIDNTLPVIDSVPNPAKRSLLASIHPRPHYVNDQKANACLIASAPELLEACKTVLARTDHTNIHTTIEDMRDTWELLRVAIAKAEGK